MKKKYKKRMIYDAMGLRLAVALEWVLERLPQSVNINPEYTMKGKAQTLCDYFLVNGAGKRDAEAVVRIVEERNKIAHAGGGHLPYLSGQDFKHMREDCVTVDKLLGDAFGIPQKKLPMSNLIFHSLPYDMGNAGDLIKHGALVYFVRWWFNEKGKDRPFRFADPFGGCPWEVVENKEINRRLEKLKKVAPNVASCLSRDKRYYNSGHVVNFAARGKAEVRTSDASDIARADLMASFIDDDNMELLKAPDHKHEDGYSILGRAGEFDLVLLDPFGDFLYNEATSGFPKLKQIKSITETPAPDGRDVCVAVFILDMRPNRIRENYVKFKNEELGDIAISLRCPKILDDKVKGEKNYDMEILLISKAFANNGGWRLRASLEGFKNSLQEILFPHGDKEIEIYPR